MLKKKNKIVSMLLCFLLVTQQTYSLGNKSIASLIGVAAAFVVGCYTYQNETQKNDDTGKNLQPKSFKKTILCASLAGVAFDALSYLVLQTYNVKKDDVINSASAPTIPETITSTTIPVPVVPFEPVAPASIPTTSTVSYNAGPSTINPIVVNTGPTGAGTTNTFRRDEIFTDAWQNGNKSKLNHPEPSASTGAINTGPTGVGITNTFRRDEIFTDAWQNEDRRKNTIVN